MKKIVQRLAAAVLSGCTIWSMAAGAFAASPAASIGSTAYPTLNAAIAAAKNGETIVLQSDIDSVKETYYVGVGKGAAYFGSTAKIVGQRNTARAVVDRKQLLDELDWR